MRRRRLRSWLAVALVSLVGCGEVGRPSDVPSPPVASPSPVPVPTVSPSPSGSIVYFVADPDRIKRGEASDLRWECTGDVPFVEIAILTLPPPLLGPFPSKGNVRVPPKQDESIHYDPIPRATSKFRPRASGSSSPHGTVRQTTLAYSPCRWITNRYSGRRRQVGAPPLIWVFGGLAQ